MSGKERGCGTSGAEQPHHRAVIENQIWQETNDMRTVHGLRRLKFVVDLRAVAYEHSRDMCRRRFFDHVNPDGLAPGDRAQRAKVHLRMLGENLIMIDTNRILIQSAVDRRELSVSLVRSWMNSPGHRRNILEPAFELIGVGVYVTSDDIYATQLFGK